MFCQGLRVRFYPWFFTVKIFTIHIIVLMVFSGCADSTSNSPEFANHVSAEELDKRWATIRTAIKQIRDGDLVLRCGNDQASGSLRDFNQKDIVFSHSGIAIKTDSGIYIYHNMAGEMNPDEIMRYDPVDSFLSPVQNTAIGIYRYALSADEVKLLRTLIISHYNNKLMFDMNFDLSTDEKMYCSEMIAKSVSGITNNRIRFSTSQVNEQLKERYLKMALQKNVIPSETAAEQREYLAIDDLYLNHFCKEIFKMIFQDIAMPQQFPTPEEYKK